MRRTILKNKKGRSTHSADSNSIKDSDGGSVDKSGDSEGGKDGGGGGGKFGGGEISNAGDAVNEDDDENVVLSGGEMKRVWLGSSKLGRPVPHRPLCCPLGVYEGYEK